MNFAPRKSMLGQIWDGIDAATVEIEREHNIGAKSGFSIAPDMTFLDWVDRLCEQGLKVDGRPFDLSNRSALRDIYASIPSTVEEAYGQRIAIMKGAQTGLTVLTFLLMIYLALKYAPMKAGVFYPDQTLAAYVSGKRFLPTLKTVPDGYAALLEANKGNEGNVMVRTLGSSDILFLYTSGGVSTESYPLDAVIADEVQGMLVDDIERVMERMSASYLRLFFACSTAKWPGADIDFLFQRGDQRKFHTDCRCEGGIILDERFPDCVTFNSGGRFPDAPADYVYHCPACETYIPDPQRGSWVRHNPSSQRVSWSFPQTLSPTVSPREIYESYRDATDLQNFFNRKLGRPWTDPDQVPITLEICQRQANEGMARGVVWKRSASHTFLGIDQMGSYNVALVLERLPSGHIALIWAEFIYSDDPFARCSEIMRDYGVDYCVVEQLPNVNDARRFAAKHDGRVYLAGYSDLRDDMLQWGDTSSRSDRRTAPEDRTRYTVAISQYKAMQSALYRIRDGIVLFPDPDGLQQDVRDAHGQYERKSILREVWHHFTKTALVVVSKSRDKSDRGRGEDARKNKAEVQKIGIDPHSSFAFMLGNIAMSRSWGTGQMLLPDGLSLHVGKGEERGTTLAERVETAMPGLPDGVLKLIRDIPPNTCGACMNFEGGQCMARGFGVAVTDPSCVMYEARPKA